MNSVLQFYMNGDASYDNYRESLNVRDKDEESSGFAFDPGESQTTRRKPRSVHWDKLQISLPFSPPETDDVVLR